MVLQAIFAYSVVVASRLVQDRSGTYAGPHYRLCHQVVNYYVGLPYFVQVTTFGKCNVCVSKVYNVKCFQDKGALCRFSLRPCRGVATSFIILHYHGVFGVVPVKCNDESQVNHVVGNCVVCLFSEGL